MFLSILLLFIFIKRSFFSNFLHILCPFIVYFASFVDSIGNIHASRNLFYQLWKLTAICKMNEFLRRHFYVPFWEFVHLHMQYYLFANSILKHPACQFFTSARKPTVNLYNTVYPLRSIQAFTSIISSEWNTMIGMPVSRLKERYR